jgi:XTP/dITP diphosphohydrolase
MAEEPLRIVFATKNLGKVRELEALTVHLPLDIRPATEWPDFPDIPETGDTFAENAALKARAAAAFAGCAALADDSGLEVDALDGAPGVRSARFSDPGATPQRNTELLLSRIRSVPWPRRTARGGIFWKPRRAAAGSATTRCSTPPGGPKPSPKSPWN